MDSGDSALIRNSTHKVTIDRAAANTVLRSDMARTDRAARPDCQLFLARRSILARRLAQECRRHKVGFRTALERHAQ
jgi:hypothetical protein